MGGQWLQKWGQLRSVSYMGWGWKKGSGGCILSVQERTQLTNTQRQRSEWQSHRSWFGLLGSSTLEAKIAGVRMGHGAGQGVTDFWKLVPKFTPSTLNWGSTQYELVIIIAIIWVKWCLSFAFHKPDTISSVVSFILSYNPRRKNYY